ncbi:hypothetical protein AC578_7002 [Pseudocercospora eumusae]|uniref:Uncharacterized protein n=1 Tax=Pseudocercospora eumusae TaxID=321146 RepID=A0A139HCL1_9PEZI|nr:hypothetical protein AC578_7002 [Pseudocercospora eumusae]KXT00205.1 hypothetical protein AC578_7002 [Pseudocercospora eumusae]
MISPMWTGEQSSSFAHFAKHDCGLWLARVNRHVLVVGGKDFYATIFEASCIYKDSAAIVVGIEAVGQASQRS